MKLIKCNPKNYSSLKRRYSDVDFIVIHYTAGKNDTAENEGNYFKNNVTHTSAHFFIDRTGNIVKSVPLNRTAWSVGGQKYSDCHKTGGGRYYGLCRNDNSVSIELCAIADKYPSDAQIKAVKRCIKYVRIYCKNICSNAQIIRHFDVNGKHCPATMMNNTVWNKFKAEIHI